jgi:hypothetical protein
MITYNSYQMIKKSVTKTVTVFIVNQLIKRYLLKINFDMFEQDWLQAVLATMGGFMIHDLFTYQIRDKIINKYKIDNDVHKGIINDIFYFGTMLVSKEIILANVNSRKIDMNNFKNIGLVLLGFVFYNILFKNKSKKIYNELAEDKPSLNYGFTSNIATFTDTSKTILAILVSDFIPDYGIDLSTLPTIFSLAISIPVFHLITGPLVEVAQ